jgi:hypothetical protein
MARDRLPLFWVVKNWLFLCQLNQQGLGLPLVADFPLYSLIFRYHTHLLKLRTFCFIRTTPLCLFKYWLQSDG